MGQSEAVFGRFVLTADGLTRDGKPVAVGQRGLALLDALAHSDGPVEKAALMDAGWPGTIVEEGNLTVQIAAVRKALGPREDGQEWIVTVPRVGYRLLRGDTALDAPGPAQLPRLAVLPFQNISGDAEQQYFADGVVEEITMALSRFTAFAVVSRNSSFVYKGRAVDVRTVAQELGVRYVLEGSVRRAGNRLRVTAQLIDGENGAHLWADRYDGSLEDIFAVQDKIVEGVAVVIEPAIQRAEIQRSRRDRPGSVAAYDLYLKGLHRLNTSAIEDNATAFDLFNRAIAMEPENGVYLIHAAWTWAIARAMGWPGPQATLESQIALALRAVQFAPRDGDVLGRACLILIHVTREYDLAEKLIERALEANPNAFWVMHCAGVYNVHCGVLDLALHYFRRASELSPNEPGTSHTLTGVAHVYMAMGRYADAVSWAERSLVINRGYSATYWMLVAGNAKLGRLMEARRFLELFMAASPGTTINSIRLGQPAKTADRLEPIFEGLRLAGLPEN